MSEDDDDEFIDGYLMVSVICNGIFEVLVVISPFKKCINKIYIYIFK